MSGSLVLTTASATELTKVRSKKKRDLWTFLTMSCIMICSVHGSAVPEFPRKSRIFYHVEPERAGQ